MPATRFRTPIWEPGMNLKPIGDRVIVKREAAEGKTAGGIILPDAAKNKPQRGTVLAVGPGKAKKDGGKIPMQLKVGDKVLFTTWAGDEYKDRSSKDVILIMHEEDVMAVVE